MKKRVKKGEQYWVGSLLVTKSIIVIVDRNDENGKRHLEKDVTGFSDEEIVAEVREIEKEHAFLLMGRKLLVLHT